MIKYCRNQSFQIVPFLGHSVWSSYEAVWFFLADQTGTMHQAQGYNSTASGTAAASTAFTNSSLCAALP